VRFFSGGAVSFKNKCANPGCNRPASEAATNVPPIAAAPAAAAADEGGEAEMEAEMEMEHDEFRMLLLKELMRWFKTEFFTWCGTATATSFWTLARAFRSSTSPRTRRVLRSTWCPRGLVADRCLESDVVTNFGGFRVNALPCSRCGGESEVRLTFSFSLGFWGLD